MVLHIRHDPLKGIAPEMLASWFANIGGDMELQGRRLDKYLVFRV